MATDLELIYIGDPMCSWCWGFAPTLAAVQRHFTLPVRLVLGGLRPGPSAEVLTPASRATIASHWHHVEKASGQPFDHSGLDRPSTWRYDTELPSIAVVVMRAMAPDHALAFYHRLQRAFYAERVDVTDIGVYRDLVTEFIANIAPDDPGRKPPVDAFLEQLIDPEMKRQTWADFAFARKLGVNGFPTLLLREGERYVAVSPGWSAADTLIPALEGWLRGHHAAALPGLLCGADGCALPSAGTAADDDDDDDDDEG